MNCKDFREIADSYLSDELLVETNHDVLRHLENCADCRAELAARRNLREKLRFSVKNSPVSQIDPAFSTSLRANLRAKARRQESSWNWGNLFNLKKMAAAAAVIFLMFAVGIIWRNAVEKPVEKTGLNPKSSLPANITHENNSLTVQNASFIKVKNDAVDDHKFCALKFSLNEKPISLEEAAERFEKYNKGLDLAVIEPLQEVFGDKVKLLEAHYCIVNGRPFAHVVLKYQNRIISVTVTKREDDGNQADAGNAISCNSVEDLQVACFETKKHSVFVISDLPESDNLQIARTITESLKKHIAKTEV